MPDTESDAELVARVREGDAGAYDALVRRHLRGALGVALALLGEPADAEDVVQDAFLAALDRLDDCRHPERFRQWLHEIVRNRAHNARAAYGWRNARPLAAAGVASAPGGPGADAERAELREHLTAALGALTDAQRQVVVLHDLEGWTHREIAASLGISEVMSRQHLFVARRALRQRLGPRTLLEHRHG